MIGPYETGRVYEGDCLELMGVIPEGAIDAVITDPPFNAGRNFANDSLEKREWEAFCLSIAVACARIADNAVVEVGKNDLSMWGAFSKKMIYRWALCLNYTNAMRQGAVGYANWGMVLWFSTKPYGGCFQRYMDRIDAPLESTIREFSHPSPKQIPHYRRLIQMFSPEGAIVLDPFAGSGTTGIACEELGREFLGFEIDPEYVALSNERITAARKGITLAEERTGQGMLFTE